MKTTIYFFKQHDPSGLGYVSHAEINNKITQHVQMIQTQSKQVSENGLNKGERNT